MSEIDLFYRRFEDKHRGSRELITQRLSFYLPFLSPLGTIYPKCDALDLGCGRGEWLELISQQTSFKALGIDLDAGMLEICQQNGLNVLNGDALAYLDRLESASQGLITGFHIAEHLPFDLLRTMVSKAHDVLKPGGLLILETPNPENIVVGTSEFYMDPTHQQPIPPNLLAFIAEYYGFKRVKIVRLQELKEYNSVEAPISLIDVFTGVSPDYAIVAQKDADPLTLTQFDDVFSRNYGVTLEELAERHHQKYNIQFMNAIADINAKLEHNQRVSESYLEQIVQMKSSTSWRITSPLRKLAEAVRRFKQR